MKKLTIGMAVHSDYDGVVFTLQGLRLYHHLKNVELLVVDNDPDSPEGQATKDFIAKIQSKWPARYIPFKEVKGTSASRNLVFSEASGEIVMCMDSHVLLGPGALYYLMGFYDQFPDSMDLLQGPLIYEDPAGFSTHFTDKWQAEMWGVWGMDPRGEHPDNPPFEIPGQGLGLFACRKTAWLGFNPHFRSFGGEEMYIHTKFRQAGRKTWCLPGLRWWHRFGRPRGVNYPLNREDKVRNYLLGHLELKLSLDRVYNHFVKEIGMPQEHFDLLLAEATQLTKSENNEALEPVVTNEPVVEIIENTGGCQGCQNKAEAIKKALDSVKLSEFTKYFEEATCIVEITEKRDSSHTELILGKPKQIISICEDAQGISNGAQFNIKGVNVRLFDKLENAIPFVPYKFNCLSINTENNFDANLRDLKQFQIDVAILKVKKELVASFIANTGHNWSVVEEKNGVVVLSQQKEAKKKLPPLFSRVKTFIKALFKHTKNNFGNAPAEVQKKRYSLCLLCPSRNGEHCSECGCPVKEKTKWQTEACPLKKW